MLQFLDEKVFTAYNLGLAVGIFVIMLVVKFIYMGLTIIWINLEKVILNVFKDREVATFCRKFGNLFFSNRFKWSDPVEDMNRSTVRVREAIRREIHSSDSIYSKIQKDQQDMWDWDQRRSQIVWTAIFFIVCYYAFK